MAGEPVEALPEELKAWLSEKARRADTSERELLARAVFTLRLLEENEEVADVDPQSLRERTDELEDRLQDLESDVNEKIEDVRSRIVHVKHDADQKADEDHDHPEFEEFEAFEDEIEGELGDVRTSVEDLESRLDDLREMVDGGFENYEEILTHLDDDIEALREKTNALAKVLLGIRSTVAEAEADMAKRTAADELKAEANREGIATAQCETCESSVRIGLLSEPQCPHCEETFAEVRPKQGFFGSPTLTTSDRPALEGGPEPVSDEPLDVFEDELDISEENAPSDDD